MPFKGFDDLLQLIEEKMPRRLQDAFAKRGSRLLERPEQAEDDRQDVLASVNAYIILRTIKEMHNWGDADDIEETDKNASLPQFMLRH